MKPELNSEQVKNLGWRWTQAFLAQLPIGERLRGLKPQEVVSQYEPQERLRGLKLQEVLDQFDSKQIEEYLNQLQRKKAQRENT